MTHPYEPYDPLQRPTYLPPGPPQAPAAPAPRPRRPRRMRRFAPLIALIILLPAWMAFLTWRNADQVYGRDVYATGSTVPHGQAGDFAGATWRLTSVAPAPAPSPGSLASPPPRGARIVRAYLEVTPHSAAAAKAISGCSFAGHDDRGRVWTAQIDSSTEPGVSTGCQTPGIASHDLPADRAQKVAVSFLVPTDAVRSVRPMVRATTRAPYVLFE